MFEVIPPCGNMPKASRRARGVKKTPFLEKVFDTKLYGLCLLRLFHIVPGLPWHVLSLAKSRKTEKRYATYATTSPKPYILFLSSCRRWKLSRLGQKCGEAARLGQVGWGDLLGLFFLVLSCPLTYFPFARSARGEAVFPASLRSPRLRHPSPVHHPHNGFRVSHCNIRIWEGSGGIVCLCRICDTHGFLDARIEWCRRSGSFAWESSRFSHSPVPTLFLYLELILK